MDSFYYDIFSYCHDGFFSIFLQLLILFHFNLLTL